MQRGCISELVVALLHCMDSASRVLANCISALSHQIFSASNLNIMFLLVFICMPEDTELWWKRMGIVLHRRTPRAHIQLQRHMLMHMHTTHRKTHTHRLCVGKCQVCLLSLEVQCQMRFGFFSEHGTLVPTVILVVCVRDWELQRGWGSDEMYCIRGCNRAWKRTGGSFFCHLALCAIFPIVLECMCGREWEAMALWVEVFLRTLSAFACVHISYTVPLLMEHFSFFRDRGSSWFENN